MKNKKKKLSYVILALYFFMGGVEYAVILPSMWLYLKNTFHAQEYFLGLLLSAFSLAAMISGPVFGRWSDVSRKPKVTMLIGAVFEIGGNFMYFVGISKWFLLGSRFISGVGAGAESVILAEIARVTTEEERTGILSTMISIRQSGLLIGPGLNVFLRLANFDVGPFTVNKYTDPGAFMVCMWALELLLLLFFYTDLHKIKEQELNEEQTKAVLSNGLIANDTPTMYSDAISTAATNTDANQSPQIYTNVGSGVNYSSVDQDSVQSSYEKEIEVKSDTAESYKREKLTANFLYKMYLREEVVTLLAVQFISFFSQISLETMATPLSNSLLHWGELENSLMYCAAGVEIILVFVLVRILSKRLKDRTMVLMGCFLLAVANGWLMYIVPRAYNDTPSENLPRFVVGIALDMLSLPFLFVCSMSLYTKILPKEIQGLSQGIRRSTVGLSAILAPLWAGSTLKWPYLMFGVTLGLLAVSLLMLLMSYRRLLPTSETQQILKKKTSNEENIKDSVNERTPLLS